MKNLIVSLALLGSLSVNAASIFSYTVATKSDVVGECSDFLGKTSVGGDAYLRDFLISSNVDSGCPIEVEGFLKMTKGSVQANNQFTCARATKSEFFRAGVTKVLSYPIDTYNLSTQMDFVSGKLLSQENLPGKVRVRTLTENDFKNSGSIVLETAGDEALILNISGKEISMVKMNIVLKGTVKPSKIIWNFFEAETLVVKNSGVKADSHGNSVGIPGTFIAPKGTLFMNNALITGAVYVSKFIGQAESSDCKGQVSGQVNPDCFKAPSISMGCELPRRCGKCKN